MTSLIAWLDHDESDRRRMREVIDLFREQDTLDELGIGVVRDTLANLLFPGTTTVQTRARYLLFLPWIYEEIERLRLSGGVAAAEAKKLETRLIYALERGGHHGGQGVIGWEAREGLQRFPSVIYWSGLGRYGIRRYAGSLEEYFRSLDGFRTRRDLHRAGDGDEVHERIKTNWHPALPAPPDGWLDEASLTLRPEDAEFLAERIITSGTGSLLAHFLRTRAEVDDAVLPWDVPGLESADPALERRINHARRFSHVMHSAPLVYNLMLAEMALSLGMSGRYEEWRGKHERELRDWLDGLSVPGQGAIDWDLEDFWNLVEEHNPGVRAPTKQFINRWMMLAQRSPEDIATASEHVRQLVRVREHQKKGSQARLVSRRALERWGGEAGTRQLDYRWPVTRTMIMDIQQGQTDAPT